MSAATQLASELIEGIFEHISMDDYRALPAVSASDLKNMGRSPAYAHMKARTSSPSTAAQEWGTAVHTAILEPDTLDDRYHIDLESPKGGYPPGWRNTKAYKEGRAERLATPGVDGLLTARQFEDLRYITEAVGRNKIGAKLHELSGLREASALWYDEVFGLWRKCRPDWLIESAGMVVDIKTTRDHRPREFARDCLRYGYHLSASYYLDILTAVNESTTFEHYVFLCINSEAPFEVAAYTLDEDSIEQGRHDYRRHLAEWRDCVELQRWPGGSEAIEELRLPEYAITYHEEERTL